MQNFRLQFTLQLIVLEARDGDVLTRDVLVEFKENRDRLLAFDKKGELSAVL